MRMPESRQVESCTPTDAGLQMADGREIVGFSTDSPERMSGISGANLLFILDEASGIPEPIFEAVEGNRAGGAKVIMFSNPTSTSGTFYEAFHRKRNFWHTIHISAEESPNVTGGQISIPGLATAEWVEEKAWTGRWIPPISGAPARGLPEPVRERHHRAVPGRGSAEPVGGRA